MPTKSNGHPSLPTFIPLPDAAKQTGLTVEKLIRLIENGRIAAAQLPTGEIVVSRRDAKRAIKRDDFNHLRGIPISASDAADRYGIPQPTISRWAHEGHIRILHQAPRLLELDEADIAYCAAWYKTAQESGKTTRGRRISQLFGEPVYSR